MNSSLQSCTIGGKILAMNSGTYINDLYILLPMIKNLATKLAKLLHIVL